MGQREAGHFAAATAHAEGVLSRAEPCAVGGLTASRLHHVGGNRHGYAFHTEQPSTIPAKIASLMGGMAWSDFADYADDV